MRTLASRRARPQLVRIAVQVLCRTGLAFGLLGCVGDTNQPCNPAPDAGELGTVCGFQNPEDVEVIASLGVLIVSEMRHSDEEAGSLAAVDLRVDPLVRRRLWPGATAQRTPPSPTPVPKFEQRPRWLDADCTNPPDSDHFSPHGIGVHDVGDGTALLAVVSHGSRETIEVFELHRPGNPDFNRQDFDRQDFGSQGLGRQGSPLRAQWIGCLRLPPRTIANDVVISGQGSVLTTRYRPGQSTFAAMFYSVVAGLGGNTGEVLRKLPEQDWETVPNSQAAGPNGLLQATDGIYFAQTGTGSISAVSAGIRRDVPIRGYPDNLSWSPEGSIFAVSHTQGFRFVACAAGWRPCRTAWSLIEIEPNTMGATERLQHDGGVLGAASSVAHFEGRLFFGAVFGDRIGVLRESGDRPAGVLQHR